MKKSLTLLLVLTGLVFAAGAGAVDSRETSKTPIVAMTDAGFDAPILDVVIVNLDMQAIERVDVMLETVMDSNHAVIINGREEGYVPDDNDVGWCEITHANDLNFSTIGSKQQLLSRHYALKANLVKAEGSVRYVLRC